MKKLALLGAARPGIEERIKDILKNHFKNYIDDIYENWADLTINIDYGTRFEPRSLNYQIDKPCLSLIIQEYLFEIEEFNLL